jgi:hypothetical protein
MANIWQQKEIAKIPLWFTQNEREQSIELIKLGFTAEIAVNEHQALLSLEYYCDDAQHIGDWYIGSNCDELDEDDFEEDEDEDGYGKDRPNFEGEIQAHLKGAILSYTVDAYPTDLDDAESEFSLFRERHEQAIAVIKETIASQHQRAFKNQLSLAV